MTLSQGERRGYNRITWRICEKGGRDRFKVSGVPLSRLRRQTQPRESREERPFPSPSLTLSLSLPPSSSPPCRQQRARERERETEGLYHRFNPLRPPSFLCYSRAITRPCRVFHSEDRIVVPFFSRAPSRRQFDSPYIRSEKVSDKREEREGGREGGRDSASRQREVA